MKNRIILMLFVLFVISACHKDDKDAEPTVLSPKEAKEAIEQMGDDMHVDVVEMVQSEGASGLLDLIDLMYMGDNMSFRKIEGNTRKEDIEANVKKLGKIFSPIKTKKTNTSSRLSNDVEEEFVFADNLGIYEWNSTINDFEKTSSEVAYMSLLFPTNGSATNNANLKLINFETFYILDEYLPKKIVAELYINATLEASLNFTVEYSVKEIIKSADIKLFLSPFDYNLQWKNVSPTMSSTKIEILRDDVKIFGETSDLEFVDKTKEEIKLAKVSVSYRQVSISGEVQVYALENATEDADINDYIKLSVYQGNAKLGDIEFEMVTIEDDLEGDSQEMIVNIVYSDGSKELLEDAFASVIDEMETFVMALNGEESE